MHITKLHRLANNTVSVMFRIMKTAANGDQTQKDLMQPPRQCFQIKFTLQSTVHT